MKSSWMLVGALFFALMGALVKLGARHFSPAELVFYRSLFGLLVIVAAQRGRFVRLATDHWRAHAVRGLAGFLALWLFFVALAALPLPAAITLNYTSPLFLALLVALKLRRPPSLGLAAALLTGFVGVVVLLDPRLAGTDWLSRLLGLASGALAGVAYFYVQELGNRGEPAWRIVFYFTLVATLGAGLVLAFTGVHPLRVSDLPLLVGLGVTATLGQLAMTRAYALGHPLAVGSLAYATVVFASLLDVWLFEEHLHPLGWIGIVLIVASGIATHRLRPPKP